jgi:hypothetical protein
LALSGQTVLGGEAAVGIHRNHKRPNKNAAPASPASFPKETSLLRLVSALLAELSEKWKTGEIYLRLENQPQPSV